MRTRSVLTLLAVVALAAVPAAAERPIDRVPAGVDLWQTLGSGATHYDFASDPLPAGFFCPGSAPFTGQIDFEGVPLGLTPGKEVMGTTDTIIRRLDDAVFNAEGVATTRIRGQYLHLRSRRPVATACGSWNVRVVLDKDQPVSDMTFVRETAWGGTMDADLWMRVKLIFTNQGNGNTRSTVRDVHLPTTNETPYVCGIYADQCTAPQGVPKTQCAIGCQCGVDLNTGQIKCLYVYSWHQPALAEEHFTFSPCQLNYTQFCGCDADTDPLCNEEPVNTLASEGPDPAAIRDGFLVQLEELYKLGIIDEPPGKVLARQSRPVGPPGQGGRPKVEK